MTDEIDFYFIFPLLFFISWLFLFIELATEKSTFVTKLRLKSSRSGQEEQKNWKFRMSEKNVVHHISPLQEKTCFPPNLFRVLTHRRKRSCSRKVARKKGQQGRTLKVTVRYPLSLLLTPQALWDFPLQCQQQTCSADKSRKFVSFFPTLSSKHTHMLNLIYQLTSRRMAWRNGMRE